MALDIDLEEMDAVDAGRGGIGIDGFEADAFGHSLPPGMAGGEMVNGGRLGSGSVEEEGGVAGGFAEAEVLYDDIAHRRGAGGELLEADGAGLETVDGGMGKKALEFDGVVTYVRADIIDNELLYVPGGESPADITHRFEFPIRFERGVGIVHPIDGLGVEFGEEALGATAAISEGSIKEIQ